MHDKGIICVELLDSKVVEVVRRVNKGRKILLCKYEKARYILYEGLKF